MPGSAPEPRPLVRDVLLRDGSTLRLQAPTPADFEDIKAFYDGLSPESRYFRFHGFGRTDTVARADAEASGVDRLALIGRHDGRVVAVAGYDGLREPGVAEVAFAVADDDQRRGIGMRMLEQLAEIAAERGIHRFDAEVMATNRLMLGVFEHAGFAVRRRGLGGELTVSLDITPTEAVLERIDERDHFASIASLRAILAPSSVAVVGAADTPGNVGRAVLANISSGGFEGVVTPVNRAGGVVCSRLAARSLDELEIAPDLVIIAVAGDEVFEFAAEAAASGSEGAARSPRRSRGGRRGGPRARGAAAGDRSGWGLAAGRAELLGGAEHRRRGQPERDVHPCQRARGSAGDRLAIGGGRDRAARSCGGPAAGGLDVRLARQPCRRLDQRSARVLGAGRADGRGDAVRGDIRQSRALHADRSAGVAQEADPGGQGASTGRAGAQRSALAHGRGAARRRGRRRAVATSRGAAVPRRRGAVRRRRVLRAPAAAERTADRDREQLRRRGDARRRRVRDPRAGGERGKRSAEPPGVGDQRRTGRIRCQHPRAAQRCRASMR